jgi:pseudouridylate synthase
VPLLGFRTDELPLFFSSGGGPPVSARVQSATEAARIARAHWELAGAGLVLARPPDQSMDVEPLIQAALEEAKRRGLSGPPVTPFVLSYLHEASEGRTLAANRALVAANATLAAEVAVAYAGMT